MGRVWTLSLELDTVTKLVDDHTTFELVDDDLVSLLTIAFDHDESSYWDVSGEERVFVKWSHYKVQAAFEEPDDDRAKALATPLRSRIARPFGLPHRRTGASPEGLRNHRRSTRHPRRTWASIHHPGRCRRVWRWGSRVDTTSTEDRLGCSPCGGAFDTRAPGVHTGPFDRALMWLHASYQATSRFSEFACLMSGLEALAPLLDGSADQYWECKSCAKEFTQCPECSASTGRPSSASAVLRRYTTTELSWTKVESGHRVYDLRSRFLHGDKAPVARICWPSLPFSPASSRPCSPA